MNNRGNKKTEENSSVFLFTKARRLSFCHPFPVIEAVKIIDEKHTEADYHRQI
jgi:hypothetical protein